MRTRQRITTTLTRPEAPIEPGFGKWAPIWGLAVLNNVQPMLWMLLSLILSATFASAQATPNREQITLRGTVQAVDATARTVTIRGEDGNIATLDVPQSVQRLNEVKVGDVVSAVY